MKTIINKKGNTGFTVEAWNFNSYVEPKAQSVQIIIRPVTIHSCGKKAMRLIAHDDNTWDFRKEEFNPEMPIYDSMESAVEVAQKIYTETIDKSIEFNSNQDAKAHEDYAERLKAGEIKLEIIDLPTWRANRKALQSN